MSAAIVVENLAKHYRIPASAERANYSTLRDDLVKLATWPLRYLKGESRQTEAFWALKDVSFEVQPGEVVGLIGRNGAGKSTLLKIISRITKPTNGRVRLRGRVGSLLEIGTGFHPELSGRENIYLSGAVLGMRRHEIARQFDAIVAFAEVDRFLDTPVKRYSSGMFMRLAFAVMAHLEPEILLVDEVLAVGDAQFQKKCLGKMSDVAKGGRTVLFVSHNMTAVTSLCQRAVWLEGGRVRECGPVAEVSAAYQHSPTVFSQSGNENIWVHDVRAEPASGAVIDIASGVLITVEFESRVELGVVDCTIELATTSGLVMFHAGALMSEDSPSAAGQYRVSALVPPNLLNAGGYQVKLIFGRNRLVLLYLLDTACTFEVANLPVLGKHVAVPGVVRPDLHWDIKYLGASEPAASKH